MALAFLPSRKRAAALESSLQALTETVQRQSTELAESRQSLVQSVQASRQSISPGSSKTNKNDALWEAYKAITWISSAIDTISHRMTSGGFELEPVGRNADKSHYDRIMDVLTTVNEDEDLIEIAQIGLKD